jgi:hypothetical protein
MKRLFVISLLFFFVEGEFNMINAQKFISANNPLIQYFGRWDFSDSLHAKHSWPGVYFKAEFTGKKIGVRMDDGVNYYNVYIDGKLNQVLHTSKPGDADYILADNLSEGKHSLLLSKRNICFDKIFLFSGLILDNNAQLIQPEEKPKLKIEFIGDSFTAAESNEAKVQSLLWEERYPVTNFDLGFAAVIANHFAAQYTGTCRSGSGVVCDWQGKREFSIPFLFDRTLMEANEPKWNFSSWIPDLVVSTLGLNDMSGLKEKDGSYTEANTSLFRNSYKDFIRQIRKLYPKTKILLVAAHPEWIQKNVKQIVDEEKAIGNNELYFSKFDQFKGGYVANGHPTVETDKKIADIIIKTIEEYSLLKK